MKLIQQLVFAIFGSALIICGGFEGLFADAYLVSIRGMLVVIAGLMFWGLAK